MLKRLRKARGFTMTELLVSVAIIVILAVVLLPRFMAYTERARQARAAQDIATMSSIVQAYVADEGQGHYPINSNDPSISNSIAAVMQRHGIKWTGDSNGVVDPWGRPYYYAQVVPSQ
ncbi:MAG: type II secretion system protein [Moorellaceae bacterium]